MQPSSKGNCLIAYLISDTDYINHLILYKYVCLSDAKMSLCSFLEEVLYKCSIRINELNKGYLLTLLNT